MNTGWTFQKKLSYFVQIATWNSASLIGNQLRMKFSNWTKPKIISLRNSFKSALQFILYKGESPTFTNLPFLEALESHAMTDEGFRLLNRYITDMEGKSI